VLKELARELKNLDDTPSEDIKVHVNEENFSNITADIEGPHKSLSFSCNFLFRDV
jgi:ubiquitin-conjugating enzyme E2 S